VSLRATAVVHLGFNKQAEQSRLLPCSRRCGLDRCCRYW
jgi:hypothetical protein